ncbi:MAG: hypothetical protein OXL33_05200 [Chloroflexota bacterium]|nr:hypothetical protein [Chloroflexota bacterium]
MPGFLVIDRPEARSFANARRAIRKARRVQQSGSKKAQLATGRYHADMRSVGIKTLNSRLSEYVRLAASGETVLVTDRDRIVAELGPPLKTRSPMLADALLAEAVRAGDITPPLLPATTAPPRPAAVMKFDEVMAELDETRGNR